MEHLIRKTRNDCDSFNKLHVFVLSDNYGNSFLDFRNKLLRIADLCIVHSEELLDVSDPQFESVLNSVSLFVVFSAQRFLSEKSGYLKNFTKRITEANIPILPVFSGRISAESNKDFFGTIQYLSMVEPDKTALPFEVKLKNTLNSLLIPDQLEQTIRNAFAANVFVSYRKKNRKEAQKLMSLVHQNPKCRDIAFWYDEFLIGSERFPEAIQTAITDSDLFLISVTPDALSEGNYILKEELPYASMIEKPLLAAESFSTNAEEFYEVVGKKYGLKLYRLDEIAELLKCTLFTGDYEPDESPTHLYFIGLAYLNGYLTEKNMSRAIELIQTAANSDLPEAVRKMADMYIYGQGVAMNYPCAVKWLDRVILLLEKSFRDEADHSYRNKSYHELISALFSAGQLCSMSEDADLAETYYARAISILDEINANSKEAPLYGLFELSLWYDLGNAYYGLARSEEKRDRIKAGKLCQNALRCYEKSSWNNYSFCMAKCSLMLGRICEESKDIQNAETYTLSAYNKLKTIVSKSYFESYYCAAALYQLSRIENKKLNKKDMSLIIPRLEHAESILEQIYIETNDAFFLDLWFDLVLFLAMRYQESGAEERSHTEFLKLFDIAAYMDHHYDYVHDHNTVKEEKLREAQSIAYYYCAIVAGINNTEEIAYSFLVEAEFALLRLNVLSPGKYADRLHEVQDLLRKLDANESFVANLNTCTAYSLRQSL